MVAPEGDGIPALPGEDSRAEAETCTCCGGLGEHKDGHECYVCDASGTAEAQGSPDTVCEGHHGRPDDGPENAKERYGPDFVHASSFLDVVRGEFNRMKARAFAGDGYEGVTHAGIAVVALDAGRVLLAQRSLDETDAPEVRQTWEFPGGSLDPGEEPYAAALREFFEEVGLVLPADHEVVGGWRAGPEDNYQGFVVTVPMYFDVRDWTPTDEVQAVGWFDASDIENIDLRPEMANMDWSLVWDVSGNEDTMTAALPEQPIPESEYEPMTEPDITMLDIAVDGIPVHGVLAPEDVATGDGRGFNAGSMTSRPGVLPFAWQKVSINGHDGSVVVGGVNRLMRKDGLIHWEGSLMPTEEAGEFAGLLAFFGRFGVSVDGDKGSLDSARSDAEGMMWFDAVRAAGLTAVAIPAFHEAYVAFGPHPDMPSADDSVMTASMMESGDLVTFDRGAGWVSNPRATKRIHDYWTKKGEEGYAKIGWGTPGDFTRAKKLIGAKIAANSPEDMKYLNQIIAQWHHDALGYWPGDLGKPGNAPDTAENRRRAAVHASTEDQSAWEVVLTSSAGIRALPPASYFERHEDTGALVIEEPDEYGIRRTYGYAGEWGVCHIGYDGRCVEVPEDPTEDYSHYHLGRTKTADAGYLNTGLITYKTEHRDAQTILTQTPTQAHFDDITNAWAAVRVGQDDRGIWFSGVVLPHVPEDDLVLIEASGQVSGEWKYGAMRTLLTVGVPGFPVMRASAAYDEEGNVVALAASAFNTGECAPDPAERMAALRKIDAESRFDDLRAQWALREGGA